MFGTATSWDGVFAVLLGLYVVFSALFFLALFLSSRQRKQKENTRELDNPAVKMTETGNSDNRQITHHG